MDITPLIKSDIKIIQAYEGGAFKVSGQVYKHAICVSASLVEDFSCNDFKDITEACFDLILSQKDNFDVIILGTGKTQQFFPPELLRSLKSKELHIELMDTGAACRTYNVLVAEGRRVTAILLPHQ